MEDYKNCLECGAQFKVKRRDHRFCCAVCAKKWWSKKNYPIKDHPPKPCKYCGKEFKPIRTSRMYCSDYCKDSSNKKHNHDKTCEVCGSYFSTTDWKRKYCFTCSDLKRRGKKRVNHDIRYKVLKEQHDKCWVCNGKLEFTDAIVHHLDVSGSSETPNHNTDNLAAVHKHCHRLFHSVSLALVDNTWYVSGDVFNVLNVDHVEVIKNG